MDELLTTSEVAAILKVDVETIRRWHREGRLPGARIGKYLRFGRRAIAVWIDQHFQPEAVHAAQSRKRRTRSDTRKQQAPDGESQGGVSYNRADVSEHDSFAVRESAGDGFTGSPHDERSRSRDDSAAHSPEVVSEPLSDGYWQECLASLRTALSDLRARWRDSAEWQTAFDRWHATLSTELPGEPARRLFDVHVLLRSASRIALETAAARIQLPEQLSPERDKLSLADFGVYDILGVAEDEWYSLPSSSAPCLSALLSLSPGAPSTRDVLGDIYMALSDAEDRRSRGKFYTPPEIVRCILDRVGYPPEETASAATLIDPACGSGAFLTAAYRRLCAALQESGAPVEEILSVAEVALSGIDSDPVGVFLCRVNLVLETMDLFGNQLRQLRGWPHFRVYLADAVSPPTALLGLVDADHRLPDQSVVDKLKLRQHPFERGFGFVVANPPYGKVKDSPPLRQFYRESLYGHPNLYGLFLHLALRILGSDGRLGFIIPKSISSGLYFKNLRRLLLNQADITDVVAFDERDSVFEGVLQESFILVGRARQPGRRGRIAIEEAHNHLDLLRVRPSTTVTARQFCLGARFHNAFCIAAQPQAYSVLRKVMQGAVPLEDVGLRASTGKLVWNRRKALLRDEQEADALPLLWGHNFGAFVFQPERRFNGRPAYAILTRRTVNERNLPREMVVVKRITAKEQRRRLEAAYVPATYREGTDGLFLENHLNFIVRRRSDCTYSLLYLTAILNSRLADFLFRMVNGNTQVSATELNMLPIPPRQPALDQIEGIAQRSAEVSVLEREEVMRELDHLVYGIYGLADAEVECVETAFANSVGSF
jgi:adenine-specific DNA-methyltransferase